MKITHELRIWDEGASDSFFLTDTGKVLNERKQVITKSGARKYAGEAAWGALVDGKTLDSAAKAAILEWADGYEGDTENICAEVTGV